MFRNILEYIIKSFLIFVIISLISIIICVISSLIEWDMGMIHQIINVDYSTIGLLGIMSLILTLLTYDFK